MEYFEKCNNPGIITDQNTIWNYIKCPDLVADGTPSETWKENFSHWKYKLRLGNMVYLSTDDAPRKLKKGEYVTIKPGDFALLITKEEVLIPTDVMAFISMRFDYKQKGLINVSGFHVDPYYHGKLIFSAFNAGPRDIVLREADQVFMIFFQRLCSPITKSLPTKGYDFIPAEMVEQIRGRTATLASNATRLDKLEFYIKILGGIGIAIFTLLLGIILRWFIGGNSGAIH
jgi:dCTP deaminase